MVFVRGHKRNIRIIGNWKSSTKTLNGHRYTIWINEYRPHVYLYTDRFVAPKAPISIKGWSVFLRYDNKEYASIVADATSKEEAHQKMYAYMHRHPKGF